VPAAPGAPVYRRVLVKLSGEALAGGRGFGIEPETQKRICEELAALARNGVQTAVVIGGGNFFRGVSAAADGWDRVGADQIGMLATIINALALSQTLEAQGAPARVLSALPVAGVVEPYVRDRALEHLDQGRIVVFAGGTGNPFFSTDTAASLRAAEIGAQLLLKATKVDGIYDADPLREPGARRYDRLTYDAVLQQRLGVMDATAIALCRENRIPLRVFAMDNPGILCRIAAGAEEGTLVYDEKP
jgi:uridylate kinase